jgi:hypothetical protein
VEVRRSWISFSTTRETIWRTAQHLLGLPLELRLGQAHGDHGGEAREHVVLLDALRAVLGGDLELARVGLHALADHLEQALLEARQVRAALGRRDDVDERPHLGVVARAPAQRDVHLAVALHLARRHVAALVQHGDGLLEGAGALQHPGRRDGRVGSEELDEVGGAAVVLEDLLVRPVLARRAGQPALVAHPDLEARHEERGLPHACDQLVVAEHRGLGEDLPVRPVADARTGAAARDLADHGELGVVDEGLERRVGVGPGRRVGERARLAAVKGHAVRLAAAVHLDVEAGGQRVDH